MKRITLKDFLRDRTKKTKRWPRLLTFCMMILFGQLSFSQTYCILTAPGNNDATGLTNVTFNTLNNPTGTTGHYVDYSNDPGLITYVSEGSSHNLSVKVNTASTTSSTFTVWVRAWIDWNKDGTFDITTEEYDLGSVTGGNDDATSLSPTITIPMNASGEYRLRVRAVYGTSAIPTPCGTQSWSEAEDYTIFVGNPPTCLPPTGLVALASSLTEASISWIASDSAPSNGYEYAVITSVTPPASGTPISGTSVAVSDLSANTQYYLHIRANCGSGDYSSWNTTSFYTGYCTPTGTSNTYRINGVSTEGGYININNPNNGTTNPYSNYSSMFVSQSPGEAITYNITVPGGTGIKIWIDLNQDLVFDNTTELVASHLTYMAAGTWTGTLTIPSNLPLGDYRIRVRSQYYSYTFDSCGNAQYNYGEAEDYTLSVVAPPTCMIPANLTNTNVTFNSAEFSWNAVNNANSYNWFVFEQGANPETDTPIQTGNTTSLSVNVTTGLSPLTDYHFYVQTNCGTTDGLSDFTGIPFSTECLPPSITGSTPDTICGIGEATLSATADTGTIDWYDAETGGNKLGEGETFTTPVISETTSYWVSAKIGSVGFGGKLTPNTGATVSTTNNWGIRFTVTEEVTLNSVDVYSTAAGTLNVKITDGSGEELHSTGNISISNGGVTTPNVIPLSFTVPAGDYRILIKSYTGASIIRDNSSVAFPYTSPDGILTATSSEWGGATMDYYYYFYNIDYSTGCSSERTEVIATVTPAPELELSSDNLLVCDGSNDTAITITTGASNYDTFSWSPSTGFNGNETIGWIFTSTENTVYTLTATNSVTGCVTTKNLNITAGEAPILNMPDDLEICSDDIVELNSGVNNTPVEFINEEFSNGTTFPANWHTVVGANDAVAIVSANTAGGQPNQIRITGNSQVTPVINRAYYGPINTSGITELTLQWNNYLNHYNHTSYNYSVKIQTSSDGITWNDTSWVTNPVNATQAASVVNTVISTSDVGSSTFYVSFTVQGQTFGMHNWNIDNVILSGEVNHEVNWSPATNLYTDAEATIPYIAGTNAAIVYFMSDAGTHTYTATSISSLGCETTDSVNIIIGDTTPTGDANQTVEPGTTLSDLNVTGTNLTWYTDSELTIEIENPDTTEVENGNTYYVTSSGTNCESDALSITVTVEELNPCENTPLPTAVSPQTMTVGQTVGDIIVDGENLTWYEDEELTVIVDESTVLEEGSYTFYVTQTIDNCISDAIEVMVEVTLSTGGFDVNSFKTYPNPVKDFFNISYSKDITDISVVNMLGQVVINKTVNSTDTQVDMTILPTGNYIVKVNIDGIIQTVKVVKQ